MYFMIMNEICSSIRHTTIEEENYYCCQREGCNISSVK
jgi:hypothetical protein